MNNINMNLLKYFYYVAKYNSYTKAAEELLISQPSLSYSIKVLENQIDKKLFIRGKKLELTAYGKYLFDEVEKMMDIFDDMLDDDDNIKGNVLIGIRSQYSNKIFPKYISELNKIYPNLKIEFISLKSKLLEKYLFNNEVDLIIDEYEYDGIYESFLQLEDDMIVISKDKDIVLNEEFLKNNKIGLVASNKIAKDIIKKYKDIDFVEFQSTPIMIEYMNNNHLVCLSPRSVVNDYINDNKLFEIDNDLDLPHASMYITYNKKTKNKAIIAVCDFFKEHSFYELNK